MGKARDGKAMHGKSEAREALVMPPTYHLGGLPFLGYRLVVTAKLFDRRFVEVLKRHSALTLPQWRCVAQLGLSEPGTVRSLADGAAVDRAEVSRSLSRLVALGLVERQDNAGDQRSPRFVLTPEGRKMFETLSGPITQFVSEFIADIPEDDIEAADRVLWAISKRCLD